MRLKTYLFYATGFTLLTLLLVLGTVTPVQAQLLSQAPPTGSGLNKSMQVVHNYGMRFPEDAIADCGDDLNIPSVQTFGSGCDLLLVSGANGENDEIYAADGDECYKIKRTYRVINWCHWDGETDPVVIRRDEDCDNMGGDEGVWVLVRPNNVVYLDRDNNENNTNPAIGTRRCLPNPSGPAPAGHWANSNTNPELAPLAFGDPQYRSYGYYEYSQYIKVYDTSDPVIQVPAYSQEFCSYDSQNCTGGVTINFSVTDACGLTGLSTRLWLDAFVVDANGDGLITGAEFHSDANLTATALSQQGPGNYTITGSFPIGRHAFLVNAEDGCLNEATRVLVFEVVDCKIAAPVCVNGLTATLMPVDMDGDGEIDTNAGMSPPVYVRDLVASQPTSDCSGPLKLAVYKTLTTQPSPADSLLQFTCMELGQQTVYVYTIDGAGNADYCETYVEVQDPNGLCEMMQVAGVIMTAEEEPLEGVSVVMSGSNAGMQETDEEGQFAFGMPSIEDYTVVPSLDEGAANGVTTFDVVLVSKHILQTQLLDSPYKLIAADANRSGSITTLDIIQLRRIVLNVDLEYPNNTSWRFVDANYVFPNPANPWEEVFPEVFNLNNALPEVYSNIHFVAIKIGDVNGSAIVSLGGEEPSASERE